MSKPRKLSDPFMNDLRDEKGLLHPLLERIRQDNTLMLSIRRDYVNIYYRGGNLLRLTHKANGTYQAFFDKEWDKSRKLLPPLPPTIRDSNEVEAWTRAFPTLRGIMDSYLSKRDKPEREFQQLIARENNCSPISNETEYFVTDIEFIDLSRGPRFDLLAIQWPMPRKNPRKCQAALIELKYGDGALGGKAGLLKHLRDIDAFLSDPNDYKALLETMESQFRQMNELGLLRYSRAKNPWEVKIDATRNPEVIIVLANHNPRSSMLKDILDHPQVRAYARPSSPFDLRFFVASFAGYGMHTKSMLSLAEVQQLLG